MKTKTLARAIAEAQRFILAAGNTKPATHWKDGTKLAHQDGGKEVAATKRASMDLTRTLADLRGGK